MESLPTQNQVVEISEQEKAELNRTTYAKNMIQVQLALKKGFDGSDESKNPEHFFERYSQTFGDLIKNNPSIVNDFYTHQDDLNFLIESVERQLEDALPPYLKQ
ncbi:MAG: hypothetical protein KBB54_04130 [Candidatus Pacebacteria bacterium]|nr:hypothetical protein [Candidatus Paceibacterota bacterium]